MTIRALVASIGGTCALAVATVATGFAPTPAAAATNCAALASDPAGAIAGDPAIKAATSVVVAAAGCRWRQRRRPGCVERQYRRARRGRLFRQSEPDRGGQRRICRLRQRSG